MSIVQYALNTYYIYIITVLCVYSAPNRYNPNVGGVKTNEIFGDEKNDCRIV